MEEDKIDADGCKKRSMRPRTKVNYFEPELEADSQGAQRVPYRELSRRVCEGPFLLPDLKLHPRFLTAERLADEGFQKPIWVQSLEDHATTLKELGMQLPSDFSAESVAKAVGYDQRLRTIDVMTQQPGPHYTLREWLAYFGAPPEQRIRLLNVVSLPLSNTSLQEEIVAPAAVRLIDLVNQVWPPSVDPRPEVLLYALMSPAGSFTDFHVDFGGSSVWYHVVYGKKVFLLVPPTTSNLAKYEMWASSEMQASSFFAEKAEGCIRYELGPGETLLIPAGWPHAVVTPADSLVVGGNFLHGFDLRRQVDVSAMEERLGVPQSARFPLYRQLMWHAAAHYLERLEGEKLNGAMPVTSWEREGLPALVATLHKWSSAGRWSAANVPQSIESPAGLLHDLCKLLNMEDNCADGAFHTNGNQTASQLQLSNGSSKVQSQFSNSHQGKSSQPAHFPMLNSFPDASDPCADTAEEPLLALPDFVGGADDHDTGLDSVWDFSFIEPQTTEGLGHNSDHLNGCSHIPADNMFSKAMDSCSEPTIRSHSKPNVVGASADGDVSSDEPSTSGESSDNSGSDWGRTSSSRRKGSETSRRDRHSSLMAKERACKRSPSRAGDDRAETPLKRMKRLKPANATASAAKGPVRNGRQPEPPKDLVALGKAPSKTAGMGLGLRASATGQRKPSSQVQAQAQLRLQRLEAELQKERNLQARLTSSRLPLKDGGAKIAARIASLQAQIASIKATMPVALPGMRAPGLSAASHMVPVMNGIASEITREEKRPSEVNRSRSTRSSDSQNVRCCETDHVWRDSRLEENRSGKLRSGERERHLVSKGVKRVLSPEAEEAQREAAEKLRRQRQAEAAEWEARRRHWTQQMLTDQILNAEEPGEYESMWSCVAKSGEEKGPCSVAELCRLLVQGEIAEGVTVHDEEDGVTLRLGTLLAQPQNQAKLAAARLAHHWDKKAHPPTGNGRQDDPFSSRHRHAALLSQTQPTPLVNLQVQIPSQLVPQQPEFQDNMPQPPLRWQDSSASQKPEPESPTNERSQQLDCWSTAGQQGSSRGAGTHEDQTEGRQHADRVMQTPQWLPGETPSMDPSASPRPRAAPEQTPQWEPPEPVFMAQDYSPGDYEHVPPPTHSPPPLPPQSPSPAFSDLPPQPPSPASLEVPPQPPSPAFSELPPRPPSPLISEVPPQPPSLAFSELPPPPPSSPSSELPLQPPSPAPSEILLQPQAPTLRAPSPLRKQLHGSTFSVSPQPLQSSFTKPTKETTPAPLMQSIGAARQGAPGQMPAPASTADGQMSAPALEGDITFDSLQQILASVRAVTQDEQSGPSSQWRQQQQQQQQPSQGFSQRLSCNERQDLLPQVQETSPGWQGTVPQPCQAPLEWQQQPSPVDLNLQLANGNGHFWSRSNGQDQPAVSWGTHICQATGQIAMNAAYPPAAQHRSSYNSTQQLQQLWQGQQTGAPALQQGMQPGHGAVMPHSELHIQYQPVPNQPFFG